MMQQYDDGLAGSMAAEPAVSDMPPPQGAMGVSDEDMQMLMQEVVRLLQEGVSPQELMELGVPRDIIEQAMTMLQQGAQAPM